jgi:antitoxin HicB
MTTAEAYCDLPYHFVLVPDQWDDGTPGWFVAVEEFPGCISQGETPDEAIAMAKDAMLGWVSVALEDGMDIPAPRADSLPSGRFVVRLPRGLHSALAEEAARQGVSLNHFVTGSLAGSIGWLGPAQRHGDARPAKARRAAS